MSIEWFDRETLDRVIVEQIQTVDVILDIGCGIRPQSFFKPKLHILCEPNDEYDRILQNRFINQHNFLIAKGSWQETLKLLLDLSVDSIFLLDIIEHLEKEEGRRLLIECERLARKQIVLFTPLGFMSQEYEIGQCDGWGLHGAEWQTHKSGWTPSDFDDSWDIFGSKTYHTVNGKGEALDPPSGAFWAIRNIPPRKLPSLPIKLAVLSYILPPSLSEQSSMLFRLLQNLNPDCYCLLSSRDYDPHLTFQNSLNRLQSKYYHFPSEFQFVQPNGHSLRQLQKIVNLLLRIWQRAMRIWSIVKNEKCDAIMACTGDLADLPAGYLASKVGHVALYVFLFEDYSNQRLRSMNWYLAQVVESIVLKSATGVIVCNEFLKKELQRRHGIETTLIRNPCELLHEKTAEFPWPADPGEIKIVYTGAVYHADLGALHNLVEAIQKIARPEIKLHVYTVQSPVELEREKIRGWVVYHPYLTLSQVMEVQRQADILFLPLPFDSPIPEVIKTSAPNKIGEYVASGRPVLVHAPSHSFVSWYFREHECGVVVDQMEPVELAQAIRRILDDGALRQQLRENALARARTDFSLDTARERFMHLFRL